MGDEAAQLSILRERQQLAIQETQGKIKQLDNFKKDYEALKERLMTLPNKLSHDIMVPMGKKAFMPGKLVHTNEILVLLGENWFAELSAKQSADVVDRRIAVLDKQIADLRQQEGLLVPRLDFTSELEGMATEKSEMFEIKEEYDPDKEKRWKAHHQKKVKEHKANLRKEREKLRQEEATSQKTTVQNQGPSDEDIWERLDQLEREEALGREMERHSDDEEDEKKAETKQPGPKTVQWKDEEEEEEEDTEEEEYSSSDGEENYEMRQKSVLHFKHSATSVQEGSQIPPSSAGDEPVITSPTDIYKHFVKAGPVSILKKPTTPTSDIAHSRLVDNQAQHIRELANCQPVEPAQPVVQEFTKAFKEAVVEKTPIQQPEPPSESVTEQPTKRVSKFKAQRMQQKR